MYYIKKYADCWAIHNDDNGKSRPLSEEEVQAIQEEYPSLKDPKTCTIYADNIAASKQAIVQATAADEQENKAGQQ